MMEKSAGDKAAQSAANNRQAEQVRFWHPPRVFYSLPFVV